jgi:hypothetical protein
MSSRFNPIPIPNDGKAAERFAAGLLGDLLAPLTSKLVYKVDSSLDKAKSDAIDRVLGNRFQIKNLSEDRQEYTYSLVNTPVIGPIKFLKSNYQDYKQNGDVIQVDMQNDYALPWSTLTTFSRSKVDTTTNLRGKQGSVVELFGFTDWKIEMRGFIMNQNQDNEDQQLFPLRELGGMQLYCDLPDAIAVSGEMFTRLQIRQIYIKDWSLQEMEGKPNVLAFRIEALSQKQVQLNILP